MWSRKNGLESLSFEDAIRLEGTRENPFGPEKAYTRPFDYLIRGDYARFAARYYKRFDRSVIGFFPFEHIIDNSDYLLSRIQEFIGVIPLPAVQLDPGVVNEARHTGPLLNSSTEARSA